MPQSEAKLQSTCIPLIRKYPGVLKCFAIPNEAAGRSKIAQMQLVRMGLLPGVADLEIWLENGWTLYAEMKKPGGRQSERQKKFQSSMAGPRLYKLCFSWEDVKGFIDDGLSRPRLEIIPPRPFMKPSLGNLTLDANPNKE